MTRLLRFATITLLLVTFLLPLLECFDTWDSPGITSDTELPVFLLVLLLGLVLVSAIVIARAALARQNFLAVIPVADGFFRVDVSLWQDIATQPLLSSPLRT
jgi:hypothetical protein